MSILDYICQQGKIAGYLNARTVYTKEYKQYCLLMCIICDEVDFDFWYNKGTL